MDGRGWARYRTVKIHAWLLTLLALGCIPLDAQQIQATAAKPAFVFGGFGYLPRWSMNNQHEFTPEGQEDLQKWSDMITMNVYPELMTVTRWQRRRMPSWKITKITKARCSRPIPSLGHRTGRRSISLRWFLAGQT